MINAAVVEEEQIGGYDWRFKLLLRILLVQQSKLPLLVFRPRRLSLLVLRESLLVLLGLLLLLRESLQLLL